MNQIREESKEIQEPFQQSPPLTSSYNQKTRPRRQRLQRNGQIWPGDEVIGEKTNLGRQRLQRKETIWPGSEEVIGDGFHVSIRTETKKKLKDIRGNNPNSGSRVKDKAKKIVDDKKETVADSICEGSEVIGDETSPNNQEIRPRRQRLQRNRNIWPGSEVIVDDVYDSFPVDTETDDKTKPGRQMLERKEYIWPGSEVIGDSGSILTSQEKKLDDLPAKCISHIISLTTPREASRLALVCPAFKSAADSNSVWEKFLPSDYEGFISNSSLIDMKKKDLYFHLCHNPILFDNNTASFRLEQESGKKCYMAGAKWIYENSGISPRYCELIPSPAGSRFPEVIDLKLMSTLEIEARFGATIFSTKTNYAAYFVFKLTEFREGFETSPIDLEVYFEGSHNGKKRSEFLDSQLSQDGGNGWIEIKMGEFFIENGDEGIVVCRLSEPEPISKRGTIIFQGIEVRPEYGR